MKPRGPSPDVIARQRLGAGNPLLLAVISLLALSCGDGSDGSTSDCAACHGVQAEAWENFSSHKALYGCDFCHQTVSAAPGPGHRSSTACDHCHSELGHPPERAEGGEDLVDVCLTCHDPHGSANIDLIREALSTGPGESVAIDFRNTQGRADYSFAELGSEDGGQDDLAPGSGLCEVCHRETAYYNRDATGAAHFTARCTRCHDHAREFLPEE